MDFDVWPGSLDESWLDDCERQEIERLRQPELMRKSPERRDEATIRENSRDEMAY